jgi:signal transduction histidine kinase
VTDEAPRHAHGRGRGHPHGRPPARYHRHGPGRPLRRPSWWPANEPWPPRGDEWRRMRHRVLARVALVAVVLVFLAVVIPVFLVWHFLEMAGVQSPGRYLIGAGLLVLFVAAIGGAVGGARRVALPLGNLIEAAGRVEAGDYSVRVDERHRGPYELRALIRAFNDMATRLESDEAQRRTLLADVGHELRTPLAVLQGQLEAMMDGIRPADDAHLAAALEEIRVMEQLVEDLRTLTLAEAGTLALHREPTDLTVLAQDACAGFEGLAREAGVGLRVEMADDLPLVDLDPIRIRQVLGNLVSNALRYAPKDSVIRVLGRRIVGSGRSPSGGSGAGGSGAGGSGAGARVAVSVADSGPGIPPELLPRLFDRFAKSADSRGSGLGLAIARQLVEAHGGAIRVEQSGDRGTTITFELPV